MNPVLFAAVAFGALAGSFALGYLLDPSDWYLRLIVGCSISAGVLLGAAWLTGTNPEQRRVLLAAMALTGKVVLLGVALFMAASLLLVAAHTWRDNRRT